MSFTVIVMEKSGECYCLDGKYGRSTNGKDFMCE